MMIFPLGLLALASLASSQLQSSPDATCGGVNGYTCLGSEFGQCCSAQGWCGDTTQHCETDSGCQSQWGLCGANLANSGPPSPLVTIIPTRQTVLPTISAPNPTRSFVSVIYITETQTQIVRTTVRGGGVYTATVTSTSYTLKPLSIRTTVTETATSLVLSNTTSTSTARLTSIIPVTSFQTLTATINATSIQTVNTTVTSFSIIFATAYETVNVTNLYTSTVWETATSTRTVDVLSTNFNWVNQTLTQTVTQMQNQTQIEVLTSTQWVNETLTFSVTMPASVPVSVTQTVLQTQTQTVVVTSIVGGGVLSSLSTAGPGLGSTSAATTETGPATTAIPGVVTKTPSMSAASSSMSLQPPSLTPQQDRRWFRL